MEFNDVASHEDKFWSRGEAGVVLIAAAVFGGLWLWQVRQSTGFLEADACTHYQIARYAFAEPYRFVDVWGRPLKTVLYAVPAWFGGRLGVQAMSLVLAIGIAWVAMILGRAVGMKMSAVAFVCTLAQPLLFLHSFSELTELPFAFLLGVVAVLVVHGRWVCAALLAGLLPAARPEGFAFLAVMAALLVCAGWKQKKVWAALPLLGVGLAAWSLAGWWLYGRTGSVLTWIPQHWPYAGESVYTAGRSDTLWRLVKFPLAMPGMVSPMLFPGLVLGVVMLGSRVWKAIRSRGRAEDTSHVHAGLSNAAALVLFCAGAILVGHSVLYALGKMATNGELRYMLVVAPFWGVLVGVGWERGFEILGRSGLEAARFAGYAALVPLAINAHGYRVLPLRLDNAGETARFVAAWAEKYGSAHGRRRIMAADPEIYYFLGWSNNDKTRSVEFTAENVKNLPSNTLLLYDPVYCKFNSDRARTVAGPGTLVSAGWREVTGFKIGGWQVFESPD